MVYLFLYSLMWFCNNNNKDLLLLNPILPAFIGLFYHLRRFSVSVLLVSHLLILPLILEHMYVPHTALRTPVWNNLLSQQFWLFTHFPDDKTEMQRCWVTCWGPISDTWQSLDFTSHGLVPELKLLASEFIFVFVTCIPDVTVGL